MHAAADAVAGRARRDLRDRGASSSRSGGSTPNALFDLLASDDYAGRIDWSRVHVLG